MSGSDSECDAKRDINVKLTNLITKDVKISQFFKALINDLKKNFLDDEAITDIFEHYTGGINMANFDKLITKNKRKDKKEEEKFQPKDLKKPNILSLYCAKYKAECEKKNKKFDMNEKNEAYKALSTKEKEKLHKEYETLMTEYKKKYEELRQKAIADGELAADKPKRPLNGYMRFANTVRNEIAGQFAGEEEAMSKVSIETGKRWKALSDKEREKFNAPYKKEMEKFNDEMKKWKINEADRLKKRGEAEGEAEGKTEGEIQTTGKANKKPELKKEKSKKEESKKEESEKEESEKEESEEEKEKEEEKPKKKVEPKKNESKKAKAKKEESDAEEQEDEEEKPVQTPKKKGKASKA